MLEFISGFRADFYCDIEVGHLFPLLLIKAMLPFLNILPYYVHTVAVKNKM